MLRSTSNMFIYFLQVNNVLTNPNVVDQAAVFLQIAVANLAAKPETQAVLLQITQSTLAHLIAQESTLALISDLMARASIQVRHNCQQAIPYGLASHRFHSRCRR
jgi:hypothetical protein